MLYFSVRSDLQHIKSLLNTFEQLRVIEQETRERLVREGSSWLSPHSMFKHIREEASKSDPSYSRIRGIYTRQIPKVNDICKRENISWHRQGRAAPLEGSAPFSESIFALALNRPSDLMDIDNDVRDTANQAIGILEKKTSEELLKLVNPFFWIKEIFIFIVRLPYTLIELSGFDVKKVEEHLIAKLIHLAYVVALILILLKLGFASSISINEIIGVLPKP